jgi:hypothetical protein
LARAIYNEVTGILVTIKDKASAEAAKPKLKAAGEKLRKHLEEALKTLDPTKLPTAPETALKKLKEAHEKMGVEMERVAGVEGGPDAIKEYTQATIPKLPGN